MPAAKKLIEVILPLDGIIAHIYVLAVLYAVVVIASPIQTPDEPHGRL